MNWIEGINLAATLTGPLIVGLIGWGIRCARAVDRRLANVETHLGIKRKEED